MTFEKELSEITGADIRFDNLNQVIYSSDASIFQIMPKAILIAKTEEEIKEALRICRRYSMPVTARGAATGIAGGCIGRGLVIDFSKNFNKILDINFEEEYCIVQPGVILDELNRKLDRWGYRIGPETSTGNRATIGGMAANNSSGSRSLKYGKMVECVQEIKFLLSSGETLTLGEVKLHEWETHPLYDKIEKLRKDYSQEILDRFPKLDRRVSGYNLDELVKPWPINLAKLVVGSEGSLGLMTELKLKIVKKPILTGLMAVHFHNLTDAFNSIQQMLHWEPAALELLDNTILNMAMTIPRIKEKLSWLKGTPEAIVIVEFDGHSLHDVKIKLSTFEADIRHHSIGFYYPQILEKEKMKDLWEVRKAGLGLLMSKRSYKNALAFLEDIAVPPHNLPSFMEKFLAIMKREELSAGIYGHVGAGCMHIRPYVSLQKEEDLKLIEKLMLEVSTILLEEEGTLSGEHGDGEIRSWLNRKMFGDKLYEGFLDLKHIFDPLGLMNPGKVVEGRPFQDNYENLRLNPSMPTYPFKTFMDFSREGGFELAVDMCNGNGECRKKEGVMCPSYQATQDEFDTTRARANSLRGLIHGQTKNLGEVHEILDLCLSCKGCKSECPSQVDMAKMKAEVTYKYNKEHGIPLRSRIFGNIGLLLKWGRPFRKLIPYLNLSYLQNLVGITSKRPLPPLADERFSTWFESHKQPMTAKKVILFNDTYNEFSTPSVGKSAVKVLNALGYEVIVPPWTCCGRPNLSKGLLDQAKAQAKALIKNYKEYALSGIPIVGLEPSCILSLIDEYQNFKGLDGSIFQKSVFTFDQFIKLHIEGNTLPLAFINQRTLVKVHGHCHQKALQGIAATLSVLRAVPGFEVEEIKSGCCGMAGSFGYEKEHYELSMKIGELVLLPEVRRSSKETLIVANGTSCRAQIEEGAGRKAVHLAEALASQLRSAE